jgi:hypothetical protein
MITVHKVEGFKCLTKNSKGSLIYVEDANHIHKYKQSFKVNAPIEISAIYIHLTMTDYDKDMQMLTLVELFAPEMQKVIVAIKELNNWEPYTLEFYLFLRHDDIKNKHYSISDTSPIAEAIEVLEQYSNVRSINNEPVMRSDYKEIMELYANSNCYD